MNGVVMLPIWRRPELLVLALESISAARGWNEKTYLLRLDEGYDKENHRVLARSPLNMEVVAVDRRIAPTDTLNTMEGYAHAARLARKIGATFVYLLQEDVLVTRDFFEFHERCHEQFDTWPGESGILAVAACPVPKWTRPGGGPEAVSLSTRYHPWAVSLRVSAVEQFIVPHARIDYYSDQLGYVQRAFPASKIGHGQGEQDWLIDNIMQANGLKCLVPAMPRAFHAGWWSDRREAWHPRSADLWERASDCRAILADPARLAKITGYADVKPMSLDGHDVDEYKVD